MNVNFSEFKSLDDSATIKFYSLSEKKTEDELEPLISVVRELLVQWQADGKIRNGAAAFLLDRAFLAVAYEPMAGDVSGCTKDSLMHLLQDFEKRLGISILNSPRFSVLLDSSVQHMGMKDFKNLRAAGKITDSTVVFDHLIQNLGDARQNGFEKTVNNSWYAPVGG